MGFPLGGHHDATLGTRRSARQDVDLASRRTSDRRRGRGRRGLRPQARQGRHPRRASTRRRRGNGHGPRRRDRVRPLPRPRPLEVGGDGGPPQGARQGRARRAPDARRGLRPRALHTRPRHARRPCWPESERQSPRRAAAGSRLQSDHAAREPPRSSASSASPRRSTATQVKTAYFPEATGKNENGKEYFVDEGKGLGVYFPNDKVMVVGMAAGVEEFVKKQTPDSKNGPLKGAIALAAEGGRHIVGAINTKSFNIDPVVLMKELRGAPPELADLAQYADSHHQGRCLRVRSRRGRRGFAPRRSRLLQERRGRGESGGGYSLSRRGRPKASRRVQEEAGEITGGR